MSQDQQQEKKKYIYILKDTESVRNRLIVWLVGVYGILPIVDYLMPNPLYTYILNIYYL